MADEVTKRVLEALKPEFEQMRGEIRATKRELGLEIDAMSARVTAIGTAVDGFSTRHRDMGEKFDKLSDQMRQVIGRLDCAHVPAE